MSSTQEKLEADVKVILDVEIGHSVCPSDESEDNCVLNRVAQQLLALIDSAKREGYEQGYVECGMKWNGVAEEVLSSMKETRKHMERTTAQLEQSEESK